MKNRIQLVAVVLALALSAAFLSLSGCARQGEEAVVETERNEAEGTTTVRVDGDEVNERVDEVEKSLDAAGEQVAAGAERAGEALEEGARKIEAEVGPVLDDVAITAKVKGRLAADPEVAALHIDVDTIDGRVTLNGKVASEELRQEAYKLATRTEGVKEVVNLIQVAGQAPSGPSGSGR